MAFRFLRHRWHRVALVSAAVIISLILILSLLVNRYWSPILADKVKDFVTKSSDSLYDIDFSSAELHILRGSIVLNNLTLKPDTFVYNKKRREHLAPNNLVELQIQKLTISHVHLFRLYFQHKLDIGEIILLKPQLNVNYQLNHTRDTVLKDRRTPWQKISKSLQYIRVQKIAMGDVKFKYNDYSGNKLAVSELKELNLNASDLLIDSATQFDRSRLLYCRDIGAELNNYTGNTKNGLYTYTINYLKLSTQKSQLNVNGITLKPVTANVFFAKSQSDRYTVRLDSMQLNNFDFLSYHKYRILTASSLILINGALQVYGNPNPSTDKTDRVRTFPAVGLRKIYADMKIDSIKLKNIDVYYTEYNRKSKQTGSVSFVNTSGSLLNVATNQDALKKNNITTIKLTSYFINRGKLNLLFNFNLTGKSYPFYYKGTLGQMDLDEVNSATMPLTMVKITSGTLKRMDFEIHADKSKAKGKVKILYNNLKIKLLKADTMQDNLKGMTIASLFANLFILKHNNPDAPGGKPREFYVNYTRTAQTPFFGSIWQTLLSGLKPAIGLDKKTQQKTAALVSKLAANKKDHKAKKAERIKNRDARRKKRAEKRLQKGG